MSAVRVAPSGSDLYVRIPDDKPFYQAVVSCDVREMDCFLDSTCDPRLLQWGLKRCLQQFIERPSRDLSDLILKLISQRASLSDEKELLKALIIMMRLAVDVAEERVTSPQAVEFLTNIVQREESVRVQLHEGASFGQIVKEMTDQARSWFENLELDNVSSEERSCYIDTLALLEFPGLSFVECVTILCMTHQLAHLDPNVIFPPALRQHFEAVS